MTSKVWYDLAINCQDFHFFDGTKDVWDKSCWFCFHFNPEFQKCDIEGKEVLRKWKEVTMYEGQQKLPIANITGKRDMK